MKPGHSKNEPLKDYKRANYFLTHHAYGQQIDLWRVGVKG